MKKKVGHCHPSINPSSYIHRLFHFFLPISKPSQLGKNGMDNWLARCIISVLLFLSLPLSPPHFSHYKLAGSKRGEENMRMDGS